MFHVSYVTRGRGQCARICRVANDLWNMVTDVLRAAIGIGEGHVFDTEVTPNVLARAEDLVRHVFSVKAAQRAMRPRMGAHSPTMGREEPKVIWGHLLKHNEAFALPRNLLPGHVESTQDVVVILFPSSLGL